MSEVFMEEVRRIAACRFCASALETSLIDLGDMALANGFLGREDLDKPEPRYPLHVKVCSNCLLVQHDTVVPPEDLFGRYAYFSSYSAEWGEHARRFALMMHERCTLGGASKVIEIGSNDGYLLRHFVALGVPVLGVDPARNVAEVARAAGIPTEVRFFGVATAGDLLGRGQAADLLVANNVLAHAPDVNDMIGGIKLLLKTTGVFTAEFPHLLKLIEEVQFDTIYHEHFFYYSLLAFECILAHHGLRVFDVDELATHGGSLRIYACHRESPVYGERPGLLRVRAAEKAVKLDRIEGYAGLADRVAVAKAELLEFLEAARRASKRVVGFGAAATHFLTAVDGRRELRVTKVLTRRDLAGMHGFPRPDILTNARDELIEHADVIFECSGDAVHATDLINAALKAARPVVTMNPEFHVTAGSYFVGKGLVSECEGDQPGALAGFATELGFRPLVYCNIKGFRNYTPTPEEMAYWARMQNISLPMVTAATDGTKLQIEQALVANFLGATIARPGLLGPEDADFRAAGVAMVAAAERLGRPIADYVLSPGAPHGVFLVAEHDAAQAPALDYFKLGRGPHYVILRNNIFVHLEVPRMIRRIVERGEILMDNSAGPTISVAPLAKRAVAAGTRIENGIGSFDFRGICVRIADQPEAVPIGLLQRAVLRRGIEPGQLLTFDDVELEDSLALRAWRAIRRRALAAGPAPAATSRAAS